TERDRGEPLVGAARDRPVDAVGEGARGDQRDHGREDAADQGDADEVQRAQDLASGRLLVGHACPPWSARRSMPASVCAALRALGVRPAIPWKTATIAA